MIGRSPKAAHRILTTHTGSLPRPLDLDALMTSYDAGDLSDTSLVWERVSSATSEVVERQARVGVDVWSDGSTIQTSSVPT
jgi:5-methyltetrahydropteroyltriglutamate--homocysteine methyltransferase